MAKLICEGVKEGLRSSEAVAVLRDWQNKRHFIRVERDFLTSENGASYLPIAIVHVDRGSGAVLIELPHEAETGANRIWVRPEQIDESVEAYA